MRHHKGSSASTTVYYEALKAKPSSPGLLEQLSWFRLGRMQLKRGLTCAADPVQTTSLKGWNRTELPDRGPAEGPEVMLFLKQTHQSGEEMLRRLRRKTLTPPFLCLAVFGLVSQYRENRTCHDMRFSGYIWTSLVPSVQVCREAVINWCYWCRPGVPEGDSMD